MPLRVIILCGSGNSGKSRTLRRLRDDYLLSPDGGLKYRRRPVHIQDSSLRSLQELCRTCDGEGLRCVERKMGEWVDAARRDRAILLIVPFTMKYNRGDWQFNEDCILRPLEVLRRKRARFDIAYLRREHRSPERNDDMDGLMRNLFDRIIESRRDGEALQARKLFQFIRSRV